MPRKKLTSKRSKGRHPKRWLDNVHLWTGLDFFSLNSAVGNRTFWRVSHVDVNMKLSEEATDDDYCLRL